MVPGEGWSWGCHKHTFYPTLSATAVSEQFSITRCSIIFLKIQGKHKKIKHSSFKSKQTKAIFSEIYAVGKETKLLITLACKRRTQTHVITDTFP
jgi:hypothetical protein